MLAPGFLIGNRYEVTRYIASGTYGEVYEVLDHNQQQTVALKLLDPTRITGWPWDEAARLTALRSDHILPVWNADLIAGVPYIVTELATTSLDDIANQVPLPLPVQSVRYIRHASRGLARTHDDRILHRDVKLDNLFVSTNDRVLVGDFGLAYPMDPSGHAPPTGTPTTKAPEVYAGTPTSVQSDVYSVGACLYRLLTGVYPYLDRHPADLPELEAMVAAGPPTPVRDLAPHISQGLAARVETATARNPAHRYDSAASFDSDLGHLPTPARDWRRVTLHPGHADCWESTNDVTSHRVCVTQQATTTRSDIETTRIGSGYRSLPNCKQNVTRGALPGALRGIFQRLGN